jgi:hypothetical protein
VAIKQEGIKEMTRNLKALGLALIAVFALGAMAASTASAETLDHFTSNSLNEKTTITGTQEGTEAENVFALKSVESLGVHCENSKVNFHGTITGNSATEVKVHPTYGGCTSALGTATVTTTGCNYILKGTTDKYFNTKGVEEGKDATVSIECEAGKSISLATGGCTLFFAGGTLNQTLLGVKYTTDPTNAKAITVDVTVDKIHYTTNGAFACSLAGIPSTGTDGFLTEKVTVEAYEDDGTETHPVTVSVS